MFKKSLKYLGSYVDFKLDNAVDEKVWIRNSNKTIGVLKLI